MDNLKILKPGELGTGFLIEYDAGYIDPKDKRNEAFINEVAKIERKEMVIAEPLMVTVVLQKYGVENANGRIYPEPILRREAELYQTLIQEVRAVGECVPKETEVYTENGWVNADKVSVGDNIYTLNLETNQIQLEPITHLSDTIYNDELIHIYNKSSLDMVVTKNHKVVLWDRNDNQYELRADELYDKILNKDSKVNHSYIKRGGDWVGVNRETFTVGDLEIPMMDWVAFMGIYLSDGHSSGTKGGELQNNVIITQVKEDSSNKIEELLDKLPFNYSISNNKQYIINNKDLHELLFPLGHSQTKYIPSYLKELAPKYLNELLKWLLIGDGWNRHDRKGNLLREYYTTSIQLANDVNELFLKLGKGGSISTRTPKDRLIEGRLILAENSHTLFVVHEHKTKGIYLDSRFTKVEKIKHNDHVYGITVNNGTWLMRYNNKTVWTHNSDHPESSIISVERISHNITKIWWEGATLMGEMEILMSPGFINYGVISCQGDQIANLLRKGIKIGVSSRGVGSLEEIGGQNIVQDDFEIIGWDVVVSPSTPGSWIFRNRQEAQPFVEGKEKKKNLLIDNLDKFLL